MMARLTTMPVAPPSACRNRAAISCGSVCASEQPMLAATISDWYEDRAQRIGAALASVKPPFVRLRIEADRAITVDAAERKEILSRYVDHSRRFEAAAARRGSTRTGAVIPAITSSRTDA